MGVKWFGTLDKNCEYGVNISGSCPSGSSRYKYKYKHTFARILLARYLGRDFAWLCRLFNIIMQQVYRLLLRRTAWTEQSTPLTLIIDVTGTTFASRFERFGAASRPWPWDIRDIWMALAGRQPTLTQSWRWVEPVYDSVGRLFRQVRLEVPAGCDARRRLGAIH